MKPIRSYAAMEANGALQPLTIERRELRSDDVAINIMYCGICHSDIHAVNNDWHNSIYPMVPGHEITGIVSAVGSNVQKFKIGDRVGVGCFVDSCTTCKERDIDREQYIPGLIMTYNSMESGSSLPTYGGYAESIVVKEGYVLNIPDSLPLDAAAPLLCAGITLYSPLRHWGAAKGKNVAIVGMGGLGHIGVKIAHAMGAHVTVLSRTLSKMDDGLGLGADEYYATNNPATFAKLAGQFDLIISTVSEPLDWNLYLSLLRIDGALVLVGVPMQQIPVSAFSIVPQRKTLAGSMIGSIKETQEMLNFCATHQIVSEIETVQVSEINDAYKRVLKSDVRYRFVINMSSLK
ncbi:MAG: hydroxyacid dehydrogenase [Azospira oryzae]|nr:MAG: hydroxyacid dehydrogenase [Azospira oryzae]